MVGSVNRDHVQMIPTVLHVASSPIRCMFRGQLQSLKRLSRNYRVLAIESSCDDSCVSLLEKKSPNGPVLAIDEIKATLSSAKVGGIIPTAAHEFHSAQISQLVGEFCRKHEISSSNPPDLLCVTRGPGMVGSLSASIQFAKGLAVAWQRPLVGVHHMLGHLLTPNLTVDGSSCGPQYPFLSLLCSGGHTMLVLSKSLTNHEIIIDTSDIAAGDSLDKCARELGFEGNMLGPELEKYVANIDPVTKERFAGINTNTDQNEFGFRLRMPMRTAKHKKIPDVIQFGFASFLSSVEGFKMKSRDSWNEQTRQFVAFKLQEVLFDHIINRINVAFAKDPQKFALVRDFVCSGGVAANKVLRAKLMHNIRSASTLKFHFPAPKLCTDNATMIGNAGIDIFENLRLKSRLSMLPIRKWPLHDILDVEGWEEVSDEEYREVTSWDSVPCER
ncbi:putative tRNA N6-adenosine threonylcarbamoyltransferase [Clavispora lusitaniae]|uniref:N(6)-L-threonylcarbamoyladenine synthase n=1 Tax=Clavispora lusitaniae TaxID=36911 RepID=A0AA91PUZ7_CLALS|nr:putative tRNA N6-adenosine threonylcarbamoyltransferase [Clavispora lusitaniae]